MKVYFYDNVDSDQRLPHEGPPATLADLEKLGVYASNISEQAEVDRIAEERGYRNRDEVCSPPPHPALLREVSGVFFCEKGLIDRSKCRRSCKAKSTLQ
jgi:cupin superfamily acireductone dioxygenase involved in methionine salvage